MEELKNAIISEYEAFTERIVEQSNKILDQFATLLRGGKNVIYSEKSRGGICWSGFVCIEKQIPSEYLTEIENRVYTEFPKRYKNKKLSVCFHGTFIPSRFHSCSFSSHSDVYSFAYWIDALNTESEYEIGEEDALLDAERDRILEAIATELSEKKELFLQNVRTFKDTTFGLGSGIECRYLQHLPEVLKRTVKRFNELYPEFSLIASYPMDDSSSNKFLVQYRFTPN